MGLKITTLGIEVTGKVIRNHDDDTGKTTLVVSEAQVRELYEACGLALDFFDGHAGVPIVTP